MTVCVTEVMISVTVVIVSVAVVIIFVAVVIIFVAVVSVSVAVVIVSITEMKIVSVAVMIVSITVKVSAVAAVMVVAVTALLLTIVFRSVAVSVLLLKVLAVADDGRTMGTVRQLPARWCRRVMDLERKVLLTSLGQKLGHQVVEPLRVVNAHTATFILMLVVFAAAVVPALLVFVIMDFSNVGVSVPKALFFLLLAFLFWSGTKAGTTRINLGPVKVPVAVSLSLLLTWTIEEKVWLVVFDLDL